MAFIQHKRQPNSFRYGADNPLRVRMSLRKRDKGRSKPGMVFYLGGGIGKTMRWKVGDRLAVAFGTEEDEGKILISRLDDNDVNEGYTMSNSGAKKRGSEFGSGTIVITPTSEQIRKVFGEVRDPKDAKPKHPSLVLTNDSVILDYRKEHAPNTNGR